MTTESIANRENPLLMRSQNLIARFGEPHILHHIDSYGRLIAIEEIIATDYIPHTIRSRDRHKTYQIPLFVRLEIRSGQILDSLPNLDSPPTFYQGIVLAYAQARQNIIPPEGILYRFDELNSSLINRKDKKATSTSVNAYINLLNKLEKHYAEQELTHET